jgi:hypothetical protein
MDPDFPDQVYQETFWLLKLVSTRAETSSAAVVAFPANIASYSFRRYSSALTRLSLFSKIRRSQFWATASGTGVDKGNNKSLPALLGWTMDTPQNLAAGNMFPCFDSGDSQQTPWCCCAKGTRTSSTGVKGTVLLCALAQVAHRSMESSDPERSTQSRPGSQESGRVGDLWQAYVPT